MTCPNPSPKSPPQVTVVVPIYDRTVFIEDALRSLLAQTRPVHQILVVDDGSGKERREEIERLAGISDRVQFYHLPAHRGVSAARNKGLDLASGSYILFMDDDDLLHPRTVETSLALFESDPSLDVVMCLYEMFFTPDGSSPWNPAAPFFNYKLLDQHPLRLVDSTNFAPPEIIEHRPFSAFLRFLIPTNACLIRRASIGPVRFPEDLKQGEDTFFWLALSRQGCRFKMRSEPHAFVRRHALNLTRSRSVYCKEIRTFYRKILAEGMVDSREDLCLVHLKLAFFEWSCRKSEWMKHSLEACRYPDLLLREIVTVGRRALRDRRNLLRYYFQD